MAMISFGSVFFVIKIVFMMTFVIIDIHPTSSFQINHHQRRRRQQQQQMTTSSWPSKTSSLFGTSASHIIDIQDSNYRQLFKGDKYLLIDCCAPWYVTVSLGTVALSLSLLYQKIVITYMTYNIQMMQNTCNIGAARVS
jgi:hypothetical protein